MNIFVAKLNPRITGEDLNNLFSQFGEVASAKVVIDRETNRSKCFGFVEMPNDDEGNTAIKELNDAVYDGNPIVVKLAKPREENRPRRPRVYNRR
ncbi:RNA-binding protein [Puteibacter caeruleilacunae]|nr:RNA-binding protein [Puteibacter caeruleilacunae]